MEKNKKTDEELIFSLDIGTRTIIGIVGQYDQDENFKVLAYALREHKNRNMYDGQIHDIEGVAKLVEDIIKELEESISRPLKLVSLAAAGRALKTHRIRSEQIIHGNKNISRLNIEALEIDAVQKAQKEINELEENKELKYYSIGYSVVDYYLDESRIDNLEGHKGERIGIEILVTFLPKIVIEGLYSVIGRVGLEIRSITLEPIAAINVAIKKDLRLLNLALVDIGAGTSDIAITKDGQITSYAMTQVAGDEITEALSKAYLLDFNKSEKLKIKLSKEKNHKFKDIVGIEYNLSTEEIVGNLKEVIEKITSEIANKILEYNGKAPNAVFLIGGSSQMPMLKENLAEKLGLPKERVSIRDLSFIENIEGLENMNGPDMITPIGIALEGAQNKYRNFININFNEKEMRIFNTDNIKISDVLVMAGYEPRELMPKRGKDFIYYIDGKKRMIKGRKGSQPKILLDEKEVNLRSEVPNKAVIKTISSKLDSIEEPSIYDLIPGKYEINQILVNGNKIGKDYRVNYGDKITLIENDSLIEKSFEDKEESFEKKLEKSPINKKKEINLIINDEEMNLTYEKDKFLFVDIFDYIDFDLSSLKGKLRLSINNRDAEYMEELNNGDNIKIYWE